MSKTTFIAAGDCFITRRLPEGGYEGFGELQKCISSHDVKFLNLEPTFHNYEGYPAVESGGKAAFLRCLGDIKAVAHNDHFDFSEDCLVNGVKAFCCMAAHLMA